MRTGIESKNFLNHVLNPIYFIFKQLSMMLFFLITFLNYIFKKIKKFQFKILDKKNNFFSHYNNITFYNCNFYLIFEWLKLEIVDVNILSFFGILFFLLF